MSNFTDFFPAASGGSGGGILKQHVMTSSGTIDLTTLGIADGDLIQLYIVGGGSSGGRYIGGNGANIWSGSVTVGTAGVATVTIGAGGSQTNNNSAPGGQSSITGGGIPTKTNNSTGYIPGGRQGVGTGTSGAGYSGTSSGFSQGGQGQQQSSSGGSGPANSGQGGGGTNGSTGGGVGGSGILIIFYS